mmetsp:Transcript_2499/g.3177  ORF Transcript_2499/g.3177 Transcript_2499/m.3177 type:complete len:177 (-) Transcript_2499:942-1472(-)|eukprot:CAMPEP_0204824082 /NCGR_PEP_ID=MMETSP1346-20131115/2133_1 /ASSEMBLY_ACC=CAM_ASM_000771 /TAXON_ID=215587 /ORGANISM="Aplanochytrium stocchinoi, Strain GSBS06" /LENGTH=176 /DNA_ID=CAMNT_0051951041 /DNA_START=135 /DNA_END=665 /DNA_ORIENTATION=+
MVVICLGPVCIPIWALLPVVMTFFAKLRTYFMAWWTGRSYEELSKAQTKVDTHTNAKPQQQESTLKTDGEVLQVKDVAEWDKLVAETKTNGGALFVDFTATWCGPCQKIAPKFQSLAKDNLKARFLKVDIEEHPEIAEKAAVALLPTFHVYKNGEKKDSFTGGHEDKLFALVQSWA